LEWIRAHQALARAGSRKLIWSVPAPNSTSQPKCALKSRATPPRMHETHAPREDALPCDLAKHAHDECHPAFRLVLIGMAADAVISELHLDLPTHRASLQHAFVDDHAVAHGAPNRLEQRFGGGDDVVQQALARIGTLPDVKADGHLAALRRSG
jgi:hypothetical protein